jgi:glyoxylase-like metal-dependent hydrolase (beta-lactamase superfamily II)
MSRRNRFRRPQDSDQVQPKEEQAQTAQVDDGEQRADVSVMTLHLGGKNPFRCYNAYLIPGVKHVLVDPGPAGTAGELLEQLSRHRISLGDIGLIVITHGHPDHFGSASQLKEWTRAPLAVHELDAEYVNFGSVPVLKPVTRLGSLLKSLFAVKSEPVEPDIILHDGDRLSRYAGHGRVIQTPGHTAGSISILLPDGMCIVGDLLMRGLSVRTPSAPWFAENATEARESLQKVVNAGAKTLLAGHGGPSGPLLVGTMEETEAARLRACRRNPAAIERPRSGTTSAAAILPVRHGSTGSSFVRCRRGARRGCR